MRDHAIDPEGHDLGRELPPRILHPGPGAVDRHDDAVQVEAEAPERELDHRVIRTDAGRLHVDHDAGAGLVRPAAAGVSGRKFEPAQHPEVSARVERAQQLTGITDADVAGKQIDGEAAVNLLRSVDFICAHNAAFDRGMLERRLPEAAGLPWACSLSDVDWRAAGFDGGRTLGWLLSRIGLFHGAHRAGDDVDAVIALLRHELPTGFTVLATMLERASRPSWRFRAVGAAFELKDALKARGYRWDGDRHPKAWWREVTDDDRTAEEWWLAGHVYTASANPRALGPLIDRVTWRERYARLDPSD